MFAYCALVFAVCLQVIAAEWPADFPPECRGPPKGVEKPHECCKIPPFFKPEDLEECGFKKPEEGEGPPKHYGPPDCSKQICMMNKYGLAKDDKPDDAAVLAFMDKYAEENKDFKSAIDVAKDKCVGKELPGPPHICDANKLTFCISATLFSNCPKWEETDGCKTLKDHMDKCKPYFPH